MAYPVVSGPVMPGPKPRPAVVTAGSVLILVGALALAVLAIVEFSVLNAAGEALNALYTTPDTKGFGTAVALVFFGGAAALDIIFAVTLGILGVFDLRGKRPARIMSWIVGGLALVCCGCGSAVYSGVGFETLPVTQGSNQASDGPTNEQIADALLGALPSWFTGAVLGLVIVMIMTLLIGLILLSLPTSNAYFRKEPEAWLPAGDWPGYPGGYSGGYPAVYPATDPWTGKYPDA